MAKKTKQQLIDKYLKEPIKIGDPVNIKGTSSLHPEKEIYKRVKKIDTKYVYYEEYGYPELQKALLSNVKKDVDDIGDNPFRKEIRTTSHQSSIESLFFKSGWEREDKANRNEKYFGYPVPELCLNPMVLDKKGNEIEYQRGLVWTLEQKQLLIESLYNNVEIGKFVFRKRSFEWVEKRINAKKFEHTAFYDMVDGKQRISALLEFHKNGFPDLNGNFYNDLSVCSQRRFMNYRYLTHVELDEQSTDEDAIATFLAINFAGVPMSKEHIDYVKSIKI